MVFSGQNVEHLWAEELAGFLSEANRVLEDDGLLVVDSPNFPICQAYGWSHPEHITEFSIPQFTKLLEIHGFEIEKCIGLLGCKIGNELLPLDPGQVAGNDKLTETRIQHGLSNPEDSFSRWIVAKKKTKPSSGKEELLSAVKSVFSLNWPIRIQRQVLVPQLNHDSKNELVEIKKGFTGVVMYGPYLPLKSGKYLVGYCLTVKSHKDMAGDEPIAIIDCAIGAEGNVIGMKTITYKEICASQQVAVTIEISLSQLTFGVQVRLISIGAASFRASRHIIIEEIE